MAGQKIEESEELCRILFDMKRRITRRAIAAVKRSPETFGDEIVALNDIDEAIRNNCRLA